MHALEVIAELNKRASERRECEYKMLRKASLNGHQIEYVGCVFWRGQMRARDTARA